MKTMTERSPRTRIAAWWAWNLIAGTAVAALICLPLALGTRLSMYVALVAAVLTVRVAVTWSAWRRYRTGRST